MIDWHWAWWSALVSINLVNVFLGVVLFRRSAGLPAAEQSPYLQRMRVLGMIFVSVALYRSIFVSSYLEQLAWFDTLANSSLWIRFLALFAELSFAALFALAMLHLEKELPDESGAAKWIGLGPYALFGCIFIAQFFATTALVSKYEVLFAIEETLWGLGFIAITPLAFSQLRRVYGSGTQRQALRMYRVQTAMIAGWCTVYCSYSLLYHLPIEYWPHVIADLQAGNAEFRSGWGAVKHALLEVHPTREFADWGGIGFFIWHSGYFSVCVWMALYLMNGPRRL